MPPKSEPKKLQCSKCKKETKSCKCSLTSKGVFDMSSIMNGKNQTK